MKKGTANVWIATVKGGDKCFCTLQVTARPVPHEFAQPRLSIIFEGQGLRISELERGHWDNRVKVFFQHSAWADSNFCNEWAAQEGMYNIHTCLHMLLTI
jgi:hypothetical protein